ncbi:hypothetical protein EV198_2135 [Roseivirga ehrenbergii]|nr:hypothetical protein [Roseivirga ehrenbergii]TCL07702.1 hypothetical protein EV198_2135 [Roseivirga ehrenbergii]
MNCKPIILLCLCSVLFSCTERLICPAYQTSLILDNDYRQQFFSPFTVFEGDTIPKMPYGFVKDRADELDESFYAAAEGKGFRVQKGRTYSAEKEGFEYNNRKRTSFIAKIWSSPERPVLENPYLIDRILKKRPFYKLDIVVPELIHIGILDSLETEVQALNDTMTLDSAAKKKVVTETILTTPEGYNGYNVDQLNYNKKFGHLFPQPPPPPDPIDSVAYKKALQDAAADTLTNEKKGVFGMFKKRDKAAKPPKEKKKDKKNNEEAIKEEEGGNE